MTAKKIRVLVLTSSFPRHKEDWWQRAVLSIYSNMDLKKYDITVLAPSAPGAKSSETLEGIKVKRFTYFFPPSLQILTSGEGVLYTSKKRKLLGAIQVVTFVLAELLSTLRLMASGNYDLIHANWIIPQGLVAIIAKFMFRKPVVITVHGTDIFAVKKTNFIKGFILKYCDICTANSSATYEEVLKVYPKTNAAIVHMGVDIKEFDKKNKDLDWKKQFGNNSKIILGVGRLIKWKGFEYLVRALPRVLKKFPETSLLIVGKGPEEGNLRELAKHLGVDKNMQLLGSLGPGMLPTVYASADVVVSPSITIPETGEREGQGNVVLEARASGTPVVASRSGGLVDSVDGKTNGLLFEEKDYKALARNIISIFSDNTLREKLSKNGLELIREKYPWKKTSARFGKIYEDLAN